MKEERRKSIRFPGVFPIVTSDGILGETANIDRGGVCLQLEKDLSRTYSISFRIDFPFVSLSNLYLNIVWKKQEPYSMKKRFLCGGYFLNMHKKEKSILEEAVSKYIYLSPDFVRLTQELRIFLSSFKQGCDRFDILNKKEESQIEFLEKNKPYLFPILDEHFKNIWQIIKPLSKEKYKLHQKYYQKMLFPLLKDPVETNRIIADKPFGYSGDYLIITYFYNFYDNPLGNTSYEKLLNLYTCNIPIASSLVERKNFLKRLILEVIITKKIPKILSIGSGPARELVELLKEDKVAKGLYFDCLDFEERSLAYLRKEIEAIGDKKRRQFHPKFIYKNILGLMRNNKNNKGEDDLAGGYDLIYSAGMFDYLPYKVAKQIIEELYQLLGENGKLVVTNVRREEVCHRPYYETLGEWRLHYRSKEDLLGWTENIKAKRRIETINDKNSFLFLSIEKG